MTAPARGTAAAAGSAAARPRRARGLLRALGRLLVWVGLIALVIAVLYPLLWMVFSSFKDNREVFDNPWGLPGQLRWHNFVQAGDAGVVRYFTNSVIVTSASILTTVLVSAWAAYALVRLEIPFGGPVLGLLLGGLMLAPTVALIPLFGLLQNLRIFDTYWALIVLVHGVPDPVLDLPDPRLHDRPLPGRR